MSSGNNYNDNTGTQGANMVNCEVENLNITQYNIDRSHHQINIFEIFAKYKHWVREENEHTQMRRKLKQLVINGKHCYIKTKLKGKGMEFPADEILDKIPRSVTSLVTGPAGSGKSTLAATTIVNWAESEETSFDLVLFFSSLHKIGKLPLHKQLWGEYSGKIREQDSSKIYEELNQKATKILVIIDGLGYINFL